MCRKLRVTGRCVEAVEEAGGGFCCRQPRDLPKAARVLVRERGRVGARARARACGRDELPRQPACQHG